MSKKHQKALRRSKAIRRKTNIQRMKSRVRVAATIATTAAVRSVPEIQAAPNDIDEIVVTARKKEEVVLDIPMNISTITETEIKARNIIDADAFNLLGWLHHFLNYFRKNF